MNTAAAAPRWWVPGDWNGFFGLFTNVVLNVIVATVIVPQEVLLLRVRTTVPCLDGTSQKPNKSRTTQDMRMVQFV